MKREETILRIGAACTGCISMKPDREGFLYPSIEESSCTRCGLCLQACPQREADPNLHEIQSCRAAICNDERLLHDSASGGIFAAFAAAVLEREGAVFGAAMDERLVVRHQAVTTLKELPKLQGSKYVQSEIGTAFKQAKQLLEQGRIVLFSGTPCQIAGIRAYLGKSYGNLYLVDLICHGVPSPALFAKYKQWLSSKNQGEICEYRFRSKAKGWGLYYYYYYWKNGEKSTVGGMADDDPYYAAFLKGYVYRECCYQCLYAGTQRAGDVTIGDYWGIETEHPDFADKNGVSSVIIATAQGEKLLEMVDSHIRHIPTTIQQIAKHNMNLTAPAKRSFERDLAYKNIDKNPNLIFNESCYRITIKQRITAKIKLYLPVSMKWKVRKLLKR